jgi:hypothetical protein
MSYVLCMPSLISKCISFFCFNGANLVQHCVLFLLEISTNAVEIFLTLCIDDGLVYLFDSQANYGKMTAYFVSLLGAKCGKQVRMYFFLDSRSVRTNMGRRTCSIAF